MKNIQEIRDYTSHFINYFSGLLGFLENASIILAFL